MLQTELVLEINKIKEKMQEFAFTEHAKNKIIELQPLLSIREVNIALRETSEAKLILEKIGNPPLTSFEDMDEMLQIMKAGGCLTAEQLEKIAGNLTAVSRLKDFLNKSKQLEISMPYYEENLEALEEVREEIRNKIRGGKVEDHATRELKNIRIQIATMETKIREKAESVIRSNSACMAENFSTIRNGHICVPVKKEHRSKIAGSVISQSSTGNTLFIEPEAISRYTEELYLKKIDEENEVMNILYTLTGILSESVDIFEQNKRTVEKLDYAFAKAKMSLEYEGSEPLITEEQKIKIRNGRHPLLDKELCVPLNFQIGDGISGIVITGPNTGGKTVAIKTVGITCYMAQCGLHVACERAELCLRNQILCDIGDGQSLSENLSTFSSHIKNVLSILKQADSQSLVIMDELGSGTDPTEGMGIAIAILEELKQSGAFYLATTHYPDVKHYAEQTDGLLNARMAFDRDTLKPLYQLEIGAAGESCALYIAKRLGMPANMLSRASMAAYGEEKEELTRDAKEETLIHVRSVKLKRDVSVNPAQLNIPQFSLGDSVMVHPDKKIGIVCQPPDEKGMLQVQMPDGKIWISHKRVKLHVAASQLYPENYDFSIIFDTTEDRKARHTMERKYSKDVQIITRD
ncbi:MAG: endonuclease MutS2 [Lachnospiraceae bacterium]